MARNQPLFLGCIFMILILALIFICVGFVIQSVLYYPYVGIFVLIILILLIGFYMTTLKGRKL